MVEARERRVLRALSHLMPFDLVDERKLLCGAPGDGSYVLVDRCRPDQNVVSFGVGPSIPFEIALAERGHRVFMFDHTIDELPAIHERCVWIKEGISALPGQEPLLRSLDDHLRRIAPSIEPAILKIDVEGVEWEIFAEMPAETMAGFEQIAFEAHNLQNLGEPQFNELVCRALSRLSERFTLCHVHANNFGYIHLIENLPVADTLELTYIRSDLVQRLPSATFYPTIHDTPNFPELPELRLWFYPFMPISDKIDRS